MGLKEDGFALGMRMAEGKGPLCELLRSVWWAFWKDQVNAVLFQPYYDRIMESCGSEATLSSASSNHKQGHQNNDSVKS